MKKALILTVWDAPNYGSFLQAVSMKTFLEKKGYEVSFVQYRNRFEKYLFLFEKKKQLLFHPFFSLKRASHFLATFNTVRTTEMEAAIKGDYDLYIIGSDEIWNIKNDPYFSKGYFYGQGFPREKTIIYSVSAGTSSPKDIQENPTISNYISEASSNLSVRDINTSEVVANIIGGNVKITCDPTFLVNKEEYVKEYKNKLPENYIVVYSYRIPKKLEENIVRFAKEENLKIVSLCNYYSFCDYNLSCSPLEFPDIIKHSNYTVITTFHGTIFSVLNHKQFISATDKQKTVDLLGRLGLSNRLVDENVDYDSFSDKLKNIIDYKKVDKKIKTMRDDSICWLDEKLKSI